MADGSKPPNGNSGAGKADGDKPAGAEEIKLDEVKPRIEYPTSYAFKVMGKQENGFREYVRALFSRLLQREVTDPEIAEQASKGAKYVSLTVTVELTSEEQRRAIYAALYTDSTSPDGRVKYYL